MVAWRDAVRSQWGGRLLVPGLWEIATTAAASFTGAWLWRVATPLSSIVLYYLLWFGTMTVIFGLAASFRGHLPALTLQQAGLIIAILYLGGFALMGENSRNWVWALALATGVASGLYWLALYVQAAQALTRSEGPQYTACLGILETSAALVVPIVASLIIVNFPGITGYRYIFGAAGLFIAIALLLSVNSQSPPESHHPATESILIGSHWKSLLKSLATLGLRDGVLFFIPGLYLFVATGHPVLLGVYLAIQSAVQMLAFWIFAKHPWHRRWTVVLSLMGGLALIVLPTIPGIFALGILSGVAYPAFKVPLESQALALIGESDASAHLPATSQKELALNFGRLMGFAGLWILVDRMRNPEVGIHWMLILWPVLAIILAWEIGCMAKSLEP